MKTKFKKALLQIARESIRQRLTGQSLLDKEKLITEFPELLEAGAVFVTLTLNNQLRGCIGSIESRRSLFDDITANAVSAAFKDPRFSPLTESEFENVKIEISILSEPQPVDYVSIEDLAKKITPLKDGIILSQNYHRAVFLPQVWGKVKGFNEFFEFLCKKAGLPANCLISFPTIEKFNVTIIEE